MKDTLNLVFDTALSFNEHLIALIKAQAALGTVIKYVGGGGRGLLCGS